MNLQENILRIKEVMNIKTDTLNEGNLTMWVKRRISDENLENLLRDKELDFPTLCDDFVDEYDYADAVIEGMIDDLLGDYDYDAWDEYDYPDIKDYLLKFIRNLYGQYLLDTYINTCNE